MRLRSFLLVTAAVAFMMYEAHRLVDDFLGFGERDCLLSEDEEQAFDQIRADIERLSDGDDTEGDEG